MASLDIFAGSEFDVIQLTGAINKLPKKHRLITELGLFKPKPVSSTAIFIEFRSDGTLVIVQDQPRGGPPQLPVVGVRDTVPFRIPHYPMYATVMADDVLNVRAFGSETEVETVSQKVNDKLQTMKDQLDLTMEYAMTKALTGQVLSKDGSVLADFYTAFGVVQPTFELDFEAGNLKLQMIELVDKVEDGLGSEMYTEIVVLCGKNFWAQLIVHPEIQAAYEQLDDNAFARNVVNGIEYNGVNFVRSNGKVAGIPFVPDDEAIGFPRGPAMFEMYYAPANYVETVGTLGKPYYAKQEPLPFNKGINMEAQSNFLPIVNRPEALVKITMVEAEAMVESQELVESDGTTT